MSERKPIQANDFINRATKLIEIDGFEEGEKIMIRIKPVSLLAMMTKGRLPNELKAAVATLFTAENKKAKKGKEPELSDMEQVSVMQELMERVCEDAMVEPRYEDVGMYMTDAQKTQVFTAAQGNVNSMIPSNEE